MTRALPSPAMDSHKSGNLLKHFRHATRRILDKRFLLELGSPLARAW